MNTRTFTIDEDIIRRLALRRGQEERERLRTGVGFRFLRSLLGAEIVPRDRWS